MIIKPINSTTINGNTRNVNNKKSLNFKGYYEDFTRNMDYYAVQTKMKESFSKNMNKYLITNAYKNLIYSLKQFPENLRTPLFNEIFNDPKYKESPYALLSDLHEGTGSIACQALSVEAKKQHCLQESLGWPAYPLVTDEKKTACILVSHNYFTPLDKALRFLANRPSEKNGFFTLKCYQNFNKWVEWYLMDNGNLFFCNTAEPESIANIAGHRGYVYNKEFNRVKDYLY